MVRAKKVRNLESYERYGTFGTVLKLQSEVRKITVMLPIGLVTSDITHR